MDILSYFFPFERLTFTFLSISAATLKSRIAPASKINCSGSDSLPWRTINRARAVMPMNNG